MHGMAVLTPHVSLDNVSHVFEDGQAPLHALDRIAFDVPRGRFLSILGPSGCGKSTLLRTIGGLLNPTQGRIALAGEAPAAAQSRRDIGFVFQDPSLLPWRTVLGNVRLPLEIAGQSKARPDPASLLELVGLQGFRDFYPYQLSGGMQQRVAIARAIACDPSLLLMDEPFGALDEMTRASMRYELLRIWQSQAPFAERRTVVFVTHSVAEAVALSDRVIILSPRPGRVVADVDIELPRPRAEEIEESLQFRDYTSHLRSVLRNAA
jgi:NitT/TauT family transport system ATP-binding protein